MADIDPNTQADPHENPWFFRMLGWYGLTSHPQHNLAVDDEDMGDGGGGLTPQEQWSKFFNFPDARNARYCIFRNMDNFSWVTAIMDVYAEEVTQKDFDRQQAVWVESKHKHMISGAEACFDNVLLHDRLFGLARQAILLGDFMERLIYETGRGVLGMRNVPPEKVHREEDKYDRLIGFKQDGQKFRGTAKHPISFPWDFVHGRLLGKDLDSKYGSSLSATLFRSWRQLVLYEDGVLLYHVRRAPDRSIVFVNTGQLEDHEAVEYVNRVKKRFRRQELVDPASPRYQTQFSPLSPWEDIFWPVRGSEDVSRVESLQGSGQLGDPEFLDHFRNGFFGAARVPKAFFGFEGDVNAKATLAQQDVRFARGLKRLQATMIYAVRNLLDIHFMLADPDPANPGSKYNIDEHPYMVVMSPISYLDEWERLELLTMRTQLVEGMGGMAQVLGLNAQAWALYILTTYARLPEQVVLKLVQKADNAPAPAEQAFQQATESKEGRRGRSRRGLRTMVEQRFGPVRGQPKWQDGFTSLTEDEKRQVAEQMRTNPHLRTLIGQIGHYHEDDEAIHQAGMRQTPREMLPPHAVDGEPLYLEDDVDANPESSLLLEHLKASVRDGGRRPAVAAVAAVGDIEVEA